MFTEDEIEAIETEIEKIQEKEEEEKSKLGLLVTRPPHIEKYHPDIIPTQKTIIDWLNITAEEPSHILIEFIKLVIPNAEIKPEKFGKYHYRRGYKIELNCQTIGYIYYAMKKSDRNLISLSGTGCKKIDDWYKFHYWATKLNLAHISRIDLALDNFDKTITSQLIFDAYNNGKFRLPKSPNNPAIQTIQGKSGKGLNKGTTHYIGSRTSRKMARCYEKGHQVFGSGFTKEDDDYYDMYEYFINSHISYSMDGYKLTAEEYKNWFRVEIQFMRVDKDCEIPLEILINRDEYFAGSYPFCKEILEMTTHSRIKRTPKEIEIDIFNSLKHCREQYGKSWADALLYSGRTKEELIAFLFDDLKIAPSQKLIQSGEYVKN